VLIVKGIAVVFGIVVLALIAWAAAVILTSRGGGMMFMVSVPAITRVGMFMLGLGIGTSVLGCVLMLVGRMAMARLARMHG
jgi:hypothetical protein